VHRRDGDGEPTRHAAHRTAAERPAQDRLARTIHGVLRDPPLASQQIGLE
jgi:hypothetical protein